MSVRTLIEDLGVTQRIVSGKSGVSLSGVAPR